MKFMNDECDYCGRTTMCAVGEQPMYSIAGFDQPLAAISLCEPCVIGSDEGRCPDGYFHRASVRRGAVTNNPIDHIEAWDRRNYVEDMRLQNDMIVVDIKEQS